MKYLLLMLLGIIIFSFALFNYKKERTFLRISDGDEYIEMVMPYVMHTRANFSGKVMQIDVYRKKPTGFILNSGKDKK